MRARLAEAGLGGPGSSSTDSAGNRVVAMPAARLMTARRRDVAGPRGYDASGHVARQFERVRGRRGAISVVALDNKNVAVAEVAGAARAGAQDHPAAEFSTPASRGGDLDVPDPLLRRGRGVQTRVLAMVEGRHANGLDRPRARPSSDELGAGASPSHRPGGARGTSSRPRARGLDRLAGSRAGAADPDRPRGSGRTGWVIDLIETGPGRPGMRRRSSVGGLPSCIAAVVWTFGPAEAGGYVATIPLDNTPTEDVGPSFHGVRTPAGPAASTGAPPTSGGNRRGSEPPRDRVGTGGSGRCRSSPGPVEAAVSAHPRRTLWAGNLLLVGRRLRFWADRRRRGQCGRHTAEDRPSRMAGAVRSAEAGPTSIAAYGRCGIR